MAENQTAAGNEDFAQGRNAQNRGGSHCNFEQTECKFIHRQRAAKKGPAKASGLMTTSTYVVSSNLAIGNDELGAPRARSTMVSRPITVHGLHSLIKSLVLSWRDRVQLEVMHFGQGGSEELAVTT